VDRPNRYPGAATVAGAVAPSPLLSYLADMAATAAPDHPLLPEGATPETLDVTRAGEQPVWLGASPLVVPAYGAAEHVAPTGSVTLRSGAWPRSMRSSRPSGSFASDG
jgi:hypothetical protein